MSKYNSACKCFGRKLTTAHRSLYALPMRLVLQRVSQASVSVDGKIVGEIGPGYVILLCVLKGDTALKAQWLAEKVTKLRLFDSPASAEATAGRPEGKVEPLDMTVGASFGNTSGDPSRNPAPSRTSEKPIKSGTGARVNDRSVLASGGEILVISQFTLAANIQKGNRPDYTAAAAPEEATVLYEYFMKKLRELQVKKVSSGLFGAMMSVQLINDGPVTLVLEK